MRLIQSLLLVASVALAQYSWNTTFFQQRLDHFNPAETRTFQEKVLLNLTYWRPGGPIFLYAGNEGAIELFAQNTGFMWEIAPEFGAALIFPEHRYYGASLPFGNNTFNDKTQLQWLNVEQVLADYSVYIEDFRTNHDCKSISSTTNSGSEPCPVIVFGGSYGGLWNC